MRRRGIAFLLWMLGDWPPGRGRRGSRGRFVAGAVVVAAAAALHDRSWKAAWRERSRCFGD